MAVKSDRDSGIPAIIVESPAKVRTIEKFLGGKFQVLSSVGHVRDLPEKDLGVDVTRNFEPQYQVIPKQQKTITALRKALAGTDTVYLASDPDREGEAIAWHLAETLHIKTPRRIAFNEITKSAVEHALESPGVINMDLVNAQQARRVLDRLVGYEMSPILWRRIRTRQSLSAGRVQSVALRLICERSGTSGPSRDGAGGSPPARATGSEDAFTARLVRIADGDAGYRPPSGRRPDPRGALGAAVCRYGHHQEAPTAQPAPALQDERAPAAGVFEARPPPRGGR